MREEMTTLGESCQFFNGKAHEKDIDAEGQFVVVNSKFISTDGEVKKFTAKQMFPLVENDIVMVMSDVPNGKALAKCYVIEENDKYSLNQRICAIRTTEFNIRFLYYQLNRHPYLLAFNNGENQTNLRKGDILNCPLWKPSMDVQEQIVKILDEALDQIEQAQFNIEQNRLNAKELFQSKLNDIFSHEGDGWVEKKIDEVCNIKGRIGYRGYTKADLVKKGEGAITLSPSNIINNKFNLDKCTYISWFKYEESPEIMVFNNDVLFVKTGSTYGKVALVENLKEKATINPQFVVLKDIKCLNKFLYYSLITKDFKKKIEGIVGGAATPTLSQTNLGNLTIFIPNEEKQNQIVKDLDSIRVESIAIGKKYHQKRKNLEALKDSILLKAFNGELINKQEPITA